MLVNSLRRLAHSRFAIASFFTNKQILAYYQHGGLHSFCDLKVLPSRQFMISVEKPLKNNEKKGESASSEGSQKSADDEEYHNRQATPVFRLLNWELFVKPRKIMYYSGLAVFCGVCVFLWVEYTEDHKRQEAANKASPSELKLKRRRKRAAHTTNVDSVET